MRIAIIGGTGFDSLPGAIFREQTIQTPYGKARVYQGEGQNEDLFFLARHGVRHSVPPHRINYLANLKALEQLGVRRVLATFAVGSLRTSIPPLALVAIDQFIDFTHGRQHTFFEGGAVGFAHTLMTNPLCSGLREALLRLASARRMNIIPAGTYICTNGPRLETAAEIRMYAQLGGDVVGMTGVPEIPLARELGLHYAAVAYSINYAAGLVGGRMAFVSTGLDELKANLIALFVETLHIPELPDCECENALLDVHPPEMDEEG
jgi:5'-methylthioadenosine phosphorylase